MKHILIVGGTGMLREVTAYFIQQGHIVSVMARNGDRLNAFRQEYPVRRGRIWPIAQDYRDTEGALQKVREAAEMFMRIDIAILWIHDTGVKFSEQVKQYLFQHNPAVKVYQLWGSSPVNPPELGRSEWREKYPNGYGEIFLGFQRNGSSTRWLTNDEIAKGTIRAVEEDVSELTIGTTEFWDRHL